jgi:hypothetical protein
LNTIAVGRQALISRSIQNSGLVGVVSQPNKNIVKINNKYFINLF